MFPNHILSKEFAFSLFEEGYDCITYVPGRGICALLRMLYTVGIFYNLDPGGYQGRYCFYTKAEAIESLKEWNGKDDPPGNWLKHKGLIEYTNPDLGPIINWRELKLPLIQRTRMIESADIYKTLNITFHIREVSEFHIRIKTEQGPCSKSVNYNRPELVRITKQVFDPVRGDRRLVIASVPYEPPTTVY